jgi:hypothetical protein
MADHKQLFVEQRDQRDFAVRKGKSDRASVVERVRNTKTGGRNKWRKP